MADSVGVRVPIRAGGRLQAHAGLKLAEGPLVENGDRLTVLITSVPTSGELRFEGRLIAMDGSSSEWKESYTIAGAGDATAFSVPLTSGWIVGFSLYVYSGTFTAGDLEASVVVTRNTGTLLNRMMTLASGDLTNSKSLGMYAYT